jgi:glycosyltransferase involved in cell wall biosynthesis
MAERQLLFLTEPMRRLMEHYRLPESLLSYSCDGSTAATSGFFKLDDNTICFGSCSSGFVMPSVGKGLHVMADGVNGSGQVPHLAFDPDQLVDNLLLEQYPPGISRMTMQCILRPAYYGMRPLLSVGIRKHIQRMCLSGWEKIPFPAWPVDWTVERIRERCLALLMKAYGLDTVPFIWFWPDGSDSCAIVTHDVEAQQGKDFCSTLMDLDDSGGVSSSFQIVPEGRYPVSAAFLEGIRDRGFEVNVHDLNHDGNLFVSRRRFLERVDAINRYGKEFQAAGFRAGAMYRNQSWCQALEFEYDMSVPNAAHLEPQRGGCCTVFPYFINNLVELPLTTTQDYSLFHILKEHSLDLWMKQIELIRRQHGLISVLVHPDYIAEEEPKQKLYLSLLQYLDKLRREDNVWIAKPENVNRWWRTRSQLKLVQDGAGWKVQGVGSERAKVAFACRKGDTITYRFEDSHPKREETDSAVAVRRDAKAAGDGSPETMQSAGTLSTTPVSRSESTTTSLLRANPAAGAVKAGKPRGPLNICMLAYTHYESDNRVMRYAETLSERGDRVDVIVLRRRDNEPDEVINGVNVIKIQTRIHDEKGRGSYLFRILSFLLRSSWILAERHRQVHYDLIHVHSVPDFLVYAAWLPKLRGAKVILDIHDVLPELYISKFHSGEQPLLFKALVGIERASARVAHHVIIANDLWWERLVARSVPASKCTCIMNFPDHDIFHQSGKLRDDGRFVMLYPGTLNQHQGLDIAVRAFGKVRDQIKNAEFHIYGEGPDWQKLVTLRHELGLEDRVFLHGRLPLREVVKVMEDADLGVVPKRSDSFGNEAFSTKTLEFMSLGVPLIVADTAIDKYYFNDSLVRFFRSGDEDDLAEAMLQLVQSPKLREELVRNGLEFAAQNDWRHHKRKYLEIVDGLVAGTLHPAQKAASAGK